MIDSSKITKFAGSFTFLKVKSLRRRFSYYISAIVIGAVAISAIVFLWLLYHALHTNLEEKGLDFVKALRNSAAYNIYTSDPFGELGETRKRFSKYSDVAYIIFEKYDIETGAVTILDQSPNATKGFTNDRVLKNPYQWLESGERKSPFSQRYEKWNQIEIYHFSAPSYFSDSKDIESIDDIYGEPDLFMEDENPVGDGSFSENGQLTGMVHIGLKQDSIHSIINRLLLYISIIFLFLTLVSYFFADFVAKQISTPITIVAEAMKKAQNGNLSVRVNITSRDEVKTLIDSFNEMLAEIRETFRTVLQNADEVAATSEELSAAAEEITASTQELSATVHEIARGATRQSEDITGVLNNSEQVATAADSVAISSQLAEQTSHNANLSAKAGQDSSEKALTSINSISNVTDKIAKVINDLGNKSKQINTIVEVIADISRQTNLLSLNAAIEAARAGDAGRGFSVVADEVRKLAGQTDISLREISALVKKIQMSTQRAVEQSHSVESAVADGRMTINESSGALQQIIREIASASQTVQSITTAAESQQEQVQNLIARIESVASIAESNASNAEEVAATVEEQRSSMEQMASSSLQLADVAEKLRELVRKFNID
ncbi:MAG: hypothetical protein B6244_14355 [Candidatus Cloacimonetes bacterium 4572_55]|nr:MAG: hypothetical protein B6244_14355 [Candidatus Cloacimonetes bacterium 4572_55]